MEVNVIIEISKGSNIKYEYDSINKRLVCDRILQTPVAYFFNYGYIENTLSSDNDPLDAVLLCEESLFPTCCIKCRPIAILDTEDEHGIDPKVILVPTTSINTLYNDIIDINDIKQEIIDKLIFFFDNYKKMEKNKWIKINGFKDKYCAEQIIKNSQSRWNVDNYFSKINKEI